jgi:hypothetical protein
MKASFMMKMSPSWICSLPTHSMTPLDRERQRADVRRQVVLALRDHAAVGIADGGAEVAALADDERVPDALEHEAHLVDDAHEGVAEHLERDRVDLPRTDVAVAHRETSASGWSVIRMLPTASTAALVPGGSTTVLSSSSTMQGPSNASPAASRAGRRTACRPTAGPRSAPALARSGAGAFRSA